MSNPRRGGERGKGGTYGGRDTARSDRGGGLGNYGGNGGGSASRGDRGGGRGYSGGGRGGYGASAGVVEVYSNPNAQDLNVAKVEDALHPATKKMLDLGGLKLTEDNPTRPGYGTRGAAIVLTANYIELLPPSTMVLHRYDMDITPEVNGRKHHRVVQLLLQSPELAAHQGSLATDFQRTIVTKTKFKHDEDIIEVLYRSEGEDEPAIGATVYKIRVQYTKTLSVGALIDWINSTSLGKTFDDKPELTQALNIFLNHFAKSTNNLVTIGKSKAFSLNQDAGRGDLGAGLEVIRGFFSSVRIATTRILVNVNVSHGAFYHAGPLPSLMYSYGVRSTVALERFLRLVRVQTTHLKEKRNKANQVIPRIKIVYSLARKDDGHSMAHPPRVKQHGAGAKDVEFWLEEGAISSGATASSTAVPSAAGKGKGKGKVPPKSLATSGSGKYISVFDFFKSGYNLVLKTPELPVVNCGNRENPVYLPAEVCIVVPGQLSKAKLDSGQTQQMIRYAVRKPWENAASIVGQGISTVGLDEGLNPLLRAFDLKVGKGLIKVPGRVLSGPRVAYVDPAKAKTQDKRAAIKMKDPQMGAWNMMEIMFHTGMRLTNWSTLLISLPRGRDAFDSQSLATVMIEFHQRLRNLGINAAEPKAAQRLQLQHTDDPALGPFLQRAAASLDILLIILPEANMPIYKRIKNLADRTYGILTVCSVGSKLAKDKGRDQYIANVAMKFNLKLGGTNQTVESNKLGIISQNKTMVVGIDVTHPSPGSSSHAPSVSAMVASIDAQLGQWPATLRIQRARQENVDDLAEMLKSRLTLWRTKYAAALPENILIYRDGVSEGQYDMVLSQELPQLRRACEEVYPTPDTKKGLPRFTIVICGKRHKTRFYPTTTEAADHKSHNTKPGTVVDRGVTEARNWDFFLQAHNALQGTARPCHYYIVHDDIFRQLYAKSIPAPFQNVADVVEDLTHNMCYLFGRATKAVSLCPPAYYADLACERARCYLANLFDTPTPSAAPSVAGASTAGGAGVRQPDADDVLIHPRLRDKMFYI